MYLRGIGGQKLSQRGCNAQVAYSGRDQACIVRVSTPYMPKGEQSEFVEQRLKFGNGATYPK